MTCRPTWEHRQRGGGPAGQGPSGAAPRRMEPRSAQAGEGHLVLTSLSSTQEKNHSGPQGGSTNQTSS